MRYFKMIAVSKKLKEMADSEIVEVSVYKALVKLDKALDELLSELVAMQNKNTKRIEAKEAKFTAR